MVSSRLAAAWRFIKGFNLYAYPAGGIFMKKNCKRILGQIGDRLAAGRRFCRVQGRYAYPAGAYFCSCKSRQNTLGAVPQDPLTLKLRLDTNDVNIVRTAPQIRSQGACGAFYFGFCRDRIKNQPYKRRRVGRNLRLSRADPALCSGQPSPLRCILLSPQGLTTLRGPRLYGVYRRVGSLGRSPEWLLVTFLHRKVTPRRAGVQMNTFYKTLRRR